MTSTAFSHLFTLSRPHGSVIAGQPLRELNDVEAAVAALRDATAPAVVGALPFDRTRPAALSVVDSLHHHPMPWQPSRKIPVLPSFTASAVDESEHLTRLKSAISILQQPDSPLEKVVLARRLELRASSRAEPVSLLAALVAGNPAGNGFFVDLSSAGGEHR
ncbi:MAG: isochorismate synthase, partial [Rhodococcus sp. (in: high G+C Gram-positive bacteria)]